MLHRFYQRLSSALAALAALAARASARPVGTRPARARQRSLEVIARTALAPDHKLATSFSHFTHFEKVSDHVSSSTQFQLPDGRGNKNNFHFGAKK